MSTTSECVSQLYQQGYCLLPGYFDSSDTQNMRDIMDDYWKSQGCPALDATDFGFTIHPMMPNVPAMARYLDVPEMVKILSEAMRDDVRLVHLGARVSGPQSAQRIPWHNHYHWDASTLPQRHRIERMLAGVYLDGTNAEAGTLIAIPRGFNEPIGDPLGGPFDEWPGEVRIEAPPGTISLFDTALWHTAERGSSNRMRRIWGGHYQGWNDSRPHPEDNAVDDPAIDDQVRAHPVLAALLQRPQAVAQSGN